MKVGIIGGGICGLWLAYKLDGFEVYVFEKRKSFGQKACSSLVSDRIFDFLPMSEKIVKHEINGALVHFPQKTIFLQFKRRFLVFEREELEKLLFSLASKKACVYFQNELKNIPEGFDKIIFADGARSLAEKIAFKGSKSYYLGIQGFEKKRDFENITQVFPTQNGFIWKIPRGSDREWGIVEKIESAEKIFSDFLKKNNISLVNKKASIIAQGLVFLNQKKYALVGEAMGLTKPWSFGGIIWGLTACQMLLKTFPDFLAYEKEAKRFFSRQFLLGKSLKKIVYFLGFHSPLFYWISRYLIDGDFFSFSSFFENLKFFCQEQRTLFGLKKSKDKIY